MLTLALVVTTIFVLLNTGLAEAPEGSVVVFAKGEGGYYCHKIPYLLVTKSNSLLAFAEARGKDGRTTCDDFTVRMCKVLLLILILLVIHRERIWLLKEV